MKQHYIVYYATYRGLACNCISNLRRRNKAYSLILNFVSKSSSVSRAVLPDWLFLSVRIETLFHKSELLTARISSYSQSNSPRRMAIHPNFLFIWYLGGSPEFLCNVCDRMFSLCAFPFLECLAKSKTLELLALFLSFGTKDVCPRGGCFSCVIDYWLDLITFFPPDHPSHQCLCCCFFVLLVVPERVSPDAERTGSPLFFWFSMQKVVRPPEFSIVTQRQSKEEFSSWLYFSYQWCSDAKPCYIYSGGKLFSKSQNVMFICIYEEMWWSFGFFQFTFKGENKPCLKYVSTPD